MKIDKIKEFMIKALITTELHHKQWYIEKSLEVLGINLDNLPLELIEDIGEDDGNENWPWVEGIAP